MSFVAIGGQVAGKLEIWNVFQPTTVLHQIDGYELFFFWNKLELWSICALKLAVLKVDAG